jgi:hypothetical protein
MEIKAPHEGVDAFPNRLRFLRIVGTPLRDRDDE